MFFQIVGEITNIKTIAVGRRIRQLARLKKLYGPGRWRKMKGDAMVRLATGNSGARSCTGTRPTVWASAA